MSVPPCRFPFLQRQAQHRPLASPCWYPLPVCTTMQSLLIFGDLITCNHVMDFCCKHCLCSCHIPGVGLCFRLSVPTASATAPAHADVPDVQDLVPACQEDWCALHGTRIGEAKTPGPGTRIRTKQPPAPLAANCDGQAPSLDDSPAAEVPSQGTAGTQQSVPASQQTKAKTPPISVTMVDGTRTWLRGCFLESTKRWRWQLGCQDNRCTASSRQGYSHALQQWLSDFGGPATSRFCARCSRCNCITTTGRHPTCLHPDPQKTATLQSSIPHTEKESSRRA